VVRGEVIENETNEERKIRILEDPKFKPLYKIFGEDYEIDLEGVYISDIASKVEVRKAIEGSNFVIHWASLYPDRNPETPDEIIKTNVVGTTAVLQSCLDINANEFIDVNRVERLIYTSDLSTIIDYTNIEELNEESPMLSKGKFPLIFTINFCLCIIYFLN